MSDILNRLEKEIEKYEAARMFCAPKSDPGHTEKLLLASHEALTVAARLVRACKATPMTSENALGLAAIGEALAELEGLLQ